MDATPSRDWTGEMLRAIRDADRAGAAALVEAWAERHGLETAPTGLLSPALETFGDAWARSEIDVSLAQGYMASKIAQDVLDKVIAHGGTAVAPARHGPVVLGNVEDDYHPLGRRMVTAFLQLQGWEVRDLGVDVSATAFVDEAIAIGARVIGASAMMYTTAQNVRKLREEIDGRGLTGRLQLAVGGAVFKLRPELVAEFGGDGSVPSAMQAPALFERLWARSLEAEGLA
jgi:methanogenic corrinoid protein MtbC1